MRENIRGVARTVRTHQFHDCMGISFTAHDGGSGKPVRNETIYMTEAMALALSRRIVEAFSHADANGNKDFTTQTIDAEGRTQQ